MPAPTPGTPESASSSPPSPVAAPPLGRWQRLREAALALWDEYTWLTRGATVLLVLACVFGMLVAAVGDSGCIFGSALCVLPAAVQRALASDAFRTLVTLLIALLVAIHLKERQIEGKLDGSQHYDIGRALAYGYFSNFLVPSLLIARAEGQPLQVIQPTDVADLEDFARRTWPLIRSRTDTLSTEQAYQRSLGLPLKRSILVLSSLRTAAGVEAPRELFDFPSTLFTLHDYYDTWNQWLREQGSPEIPVPRIRALQQRQIGAFFGHLTELSRSEIGLASVRELGLTLAQLGELFDGYFRPITPAELRSKLGLAA